MSQIKRCVQIYEPELSQRNFRDWSKSSKLKHRIFLVITRLIISTFIYLFTGQTLHSALDWSQQEIITLFQQLWSWSKHHFGWTLFISLIFNLLVFISRTAGSPLRHRAKPLMKSPLKLVKDESARWNLNNSIIYGSQTAHEWENLFKHYVINHHIVTNLRQSRSRFTIWSVFFGT